MNYMARPAPVARWLSIRQLALKYWVRILVPAPPQSGFMTSCRLTYVTNGIQDFVKKKHTKKNVVSKLG